MVKFSFALIFAVASCSLILAANAAEKSVTKLEIGVKYKPEKCERQAKPGDKIEVHYTGSLVDGTVFDSSVERNQPFKFTLGQGQVIKGWDQGLLGACVGEKRKLKIPPSLGYGDSGAGGVIPGGATLIFETEVISIN